MASIRSLVAKLDQPTQGTGNVWVVYLKNADAVKLATVLRAAYSGGAGGASSRLSPPKSQRHIATQLVEQLS